LDRVEDGSLRDFMAEVKKQIPKSGLDMLESCNFNLSGLVPWNFYNY